MRVKWTTKIDKLPKIKANIAEIDGKSVSVGVRGEQAWLGGVHEFGCAIKITPKMRAWLHRNGLHVKDTTTHITIPERSFLRSSFDECSQDIIKDTKILLALAAEGTLDGDEVLNRCGVWLRDAIKKYATELNRPANHPFTVDRKHSSNPLVDSGDMIEHIEYTIE